MEQIRRLVTRGFPNVHLDIQEELAAEAFLRGYKSPRVAYQAMNQAPKTLADARELVEVYEHNYKAILGVTKGRLRQVTWAPDIPDEEDVDVRRVTTPAYITQDQLASIMEKHFASLMEKQLAPLQQLLVSQSQTPKPLQTTGDEQQDSGANYRQNVCPARGRSPTRAMDSKCFKRDCSRSPSPGAPRSSGNE